MGGCKQGKKATISQIIRTRLQFLASNPTCALSFSSKFGRLAIELQKCLLVNTTTATDQSRAQFAHNCVRARRTPPRRTLPHAAVARRTQPPHAARARQPLLHVGELEQLEKDLEKRRAPCVRVDGGGGRAATGVATPLLSGAARYLLWPPPRRGGLRALPQPVRACAQYHSGPWLCCGVTKDFNSDLIQKKSYRHPESKIYSTGNFLSEAPILVSINP